MPESRAEPAGLSAHFRHTYRGPNPYAPEPVVVCALDFTPAAIAQGPARCARIAELSRLWFTPGEPAERCDTPLAIAQFVLDWTLASLNFRRGFIHTAQAIEENGEILAVIGFHQAKFSEHALRMAVSLFNIARTVGQQTVYDRMNALWTTCWELHPDYQIKFVMQAARAAGVPYLPLPGQLRTWQFGWGARRELFVESQSGRDSSIGERISTDKPRTKLLLAALGIPVPRHALTESANGLDKVPELLGWPCVVKPMNAARSRGVVTDIHDLEQLVAAVTKTLAEQGSPVMIESQAPGEVYRILVARGRVACVVRRAAPHVVGDGKNTVRGLIAARNQELKKQREALDFVGEIPLDAECAAALAREGIGLDEVPRKGRKVTLRRVPLLSSGAVYTDVTSETHPDTCRMAELVAEVLGIENCGIDFVTPDIARPMNEVGAVLEANTTPGLRVPLMAGLDPLAIGRQVLGDGPARIPAALLVAPAGKLAAVHAALACGETTGWAVGRKVGVGTLPLSTKPINAEPSPQQRAAMLVRNPRVERVFLAFALADLVEAGLPLDRFDTIVTLDCQPDAAWDKVLREAADTYSKATDVAEALKKCGLATTKTVAKKPAKAARPARTG